MQIELPTGLLLNLPRHNQSASEIFVKNCHVDWGSDALLAQYLDATGCFIDVGANIGYYSLYMAPLVRHVIAVEPDERNWPFLEENARRCSNISVVRKALGRVEGAGYLWTGGNSAISHLASTGQPIGITTIDVLAAEQTVTGIKVDVEGTDLDVLRGAEATLERDTPLVLTEFTDSKSNEPSELFDFMARFEYRAFAFLDAKGQFGELTLHTWCRTAMVFLVPPRLHGAFVALIAR